MFIIYSWQSNQTEQSLRESLGKRDQLETAFETTRKDYEDKSTNVKKLEELLQTLTTGMSSTEGQQNGYMDQLQGEFRVASGFCLVRTVFPEILIPVSCEASRHHSTIGRRTSQNEDQSSEEGIAGEIAEGEGRGKGELGVGCTGAGK